MQYLMYPVLYAIINMISITNDTHKLPMLSFLGKQHS